MSGNDIEIFLGGHDLEMQAIADLAREAGVPVHDRGLRWGARSSAYREELAQVLAAGKSPVLVELEWDLGEKPADVRLVDHHGELAGIERPSSLRQVHELLGGSAGPWTRRLALVEANDVGWIPSLQAIGASQAEIADVRAADRAAQGVTAAEEAAAEVAVRQARQAFGGQLTIVDCAHDRSAPVTDRLHPALGGPPAAEILMFGPRETQYFGQGSAIQALRARFPEGWYGGALPERGFWGISAVLDEALVLQTLTPVLGATPVRE